LLNTPFATELGLLIFNQLGSR